MLFSFTRWKETTIIGKTVAGSRRVGKEIRLLAEEAAFLGVDVHKTTYSVCVWTEGREWVTQWTQPADVEALCRRLEPVRAQIARERHAAAVAFMSSVPGVGVITPMTVATELPHLERFPTPEAIGAIAGLAPGSGAAARPPGAGRSSRPATPTCAGSSSSRPGSGSARTLRPRASSATSWARRAANRKPSWPWPATLRSSCGTS